ncbi:MAG: amidohydrolase [Acidobacteriota bacterium]
MSSTIKNSITTFLLLVGLAASLVAYGSPQETAGQPADLVLRNGKIVTVDTAKPEAEALAARDGIIVAVGTNQEIEPYLGPSTKVIDLEGHLAIPGFIESHAHFMGIGDAQLQLKLGTAKSWEEIVTAVKNAAEESEEGVWIRGRGWHQEKWERVPTPNVDGVPTHHALSAVSPENPVALRHASGHASLVNAKAMELSSITRDTPEPEGGEIVKDADGNPTGLLRERAQRLIAMPRDWIESHERKKVKLAADECLSKGVTSFQDAGSSFPTIDLFKKMAEEGSLDIRLWVMIREPNERLVMKLPHYKMINVGEQRLTVRAIKRGIDGALGSHGAWLLEPYSDKPESAGLNTGSPDVIAETARLAIRHGFQLCVHAIGDRGNRETLDIFEETFQTHPEKKDLRWRIEHAQHIHPGDIPRFGKLGVIASMQGIHCTSDGPWVVPRLGEKRAREGAYPWRSLLDTGAVVSNGTDAPVEDVDPIASFYATVTRRLGDGSLFFPEQRMTREEALKSYTLSAAYAAFEEDIKGSLTPGKLADITVLSKDIMTIPEEEIPDAEVLYTIVGGEVKHSKKRGSTTESSR